MITLNIHLSLRNKNIKNLDTLAYAMKPEWIY